MRRRMSEKPSIFAWIFCIVGMTTLVLAAFVPELGPFEWIRTVYLFVFRLMLVVRIVAILAISAHVTEGFYAWYLASKIDPDHAIGWFLQTLALGYFSLRFLLKKKKVGRAPS